MKIDKDDYLTPEYRCDFFVDKKRKLLWKSELDMLEIFDQICKKYGLKYFLFAGGMLGAVRHKGFIPWDDDIDIAMQRKDYDIFLEKALIELKSPYFLQNGMNEEHYFDTIVRIRDSRTTGIIRKDINSSCNNGVFIEIFPYDNVPDNRIKAKIQDLMIRVYKNILLRSVYSLNAEPYLKRKFYEISSDIATTILGKEKVFQKYYYWCTKYNDVPCKFQNILNSYSYRDTFKYPKEYLTELIQVPFEYTYTYIPKKYDDCLKQVYKNYMEFPPINKRGQKHVSIVFYDASIDYKTYLKKIDQKIYPNPFGHEKQTTIRKDVKK